VAEVETDELPDIVLGQTLIAAKKTDSEPPKSRLKRMKKQLRTFTTQTVVAPAVIVVEQEGVSVTSENIPQTKSDCQQPEDDILSRPDIPFVEEKDEGKSNAKISEADSDVYAVGSRSCDCSPKDRLGTTRGGYSFPG
jgi:hypothetical protein